MLPAAVFIAADRPRAAAPFRLRAGSPPHFLAPPINGALGERRKIGSEIEVRKTAKSMEIRPKSFLDEKSGR
ncbi:hypothetical protein C4D60_Mb06t18750 [Musa balbisiana]|uniref:Uncharacterized protein n=1 Tax=Musa balbisiana TaxID=52838 RepID=A0A4S8IPQ3_MUSBA|nr:hypothetical protein C4D60_Mb06t18750 [Musa balbisiana]